MMVSAIQREDNAPGEISIRPLAIPDDIRWLQQWTNVSADALTTFYENIASSSFMQCMMVWENDQPILQLDICEALFDDLGASDAVRPGDYTLRLQFAPNVADSSIWRALYNCLDYVFLHMKANRVLIPVYKSNPMLLQWVKEAHFTLSAGNNNTPLHKLYMLTKAS